MPAEAKVSKRALMKYAIMYGSVQVHPQTKTSSGNRAHSQQTDQRTQYEWWTSAGVELWSTVKPCKTRDVYIVERLPHWTIYLIALINYKLGSLSVQHFLQWTIAMAELKKKKQPLKHCKAVRSTTKTKSSSKSVHSSVSFAQFAFAPRWAISHARIGKFCMANGMIGNFSAK